MKLLIASFVQLVGVVEVGSRLDWVFVAALLV
jgi:hypothetical protein